MNGYFDYAASAPPYKESLEIFNDISLHNFGNPSSNHNHGLKARNIFQESKKKFLLLLGLSDASIILTSGGTEANNLVLRSILNQYPERRILLANDSHPSCYFAAKEYQNVDLLPVDPRGQIQPEVLEKLLTPKHTLVCLVHANNETGVVQEKLDQLIQICRQRDALMHIDMVQSMGHIPIDLQSYQNIFCTFSSHKFGAPRGCGGIITGSPERLKSQICGGPQENNLRAGTENIAAFVAAVSALEISLDKLNHTKMIESLSQYCNYIKAAIKGKFPEVVINSNENGLPGLLSFSIPGIQGSITVTEMAMFGYDLSSGSACHSNMSIPSRVIQAMGRDMKTAFGTIRISMGYGTVEDEVVKMTQQLVRVIERQLAE